MWQESYPNSKEKLSKKKLFYQRNMQTYEKSPTAQRVLWNSRCIKLTCSCNDHVRCIVGWVSARRGEGVQPVQNLQPIIGQEIVQCRTGLGRWDRREEPECAVCNPRVERDIFSDGQASVIINRGTIQWLPDRKLLWGIRRYGNSDNGISCFGLLTTIRCRYVQIVLPLETNI